MPSFTPPSLHPQVRRDNCLLVRRVVDTCLRKILIERDVPGAIAYCKGVISELLQNKMDISLLVITKVGPHRTPLPPSLPCPAPPPSTTHYTHAYTHE